MFSSYEAQGIRDQRLWGLWAIWPDGTRWEPLLSPFTKQNAFHFQTQLSNGHIAVTDYYNVRLADLQSKRRHRSVALPRQVCMYLARRNTRHSLEEIGGYFGGRAHTTVMHAVKTVEARRGQDTDFDDLLESLETRTRQPTY